MNIRRMISVIAACGLLLGVHNGYIALWRDGVQEPVRVFPYRAELLPQRDQMLLEAGIPIESQSRLHSLLEDYLS